MASRTATIIGATGMIGTYLVEELKKDGSFDTIRLIVRRPVERTDSAVEVKLVDFRDHESLQLALEGTTVLFCAIGTTQKNVKGDKELYRFIDLEIPVRAAKLAKEGGAETMVIVSAIGAKKGSSNFYINLKGEMEEVVAAVGLRSTYFLQPSMLLGDRAEKRPAERFFQVVMKGASNMLFGSWRRFKAIHGRDVARAMIRAAKQSTPGVHRWKYDEMNAAP